MSRKSILTVLVVCSFALTAVVAQATTINLPINNPSFETPVISTAMNFSNVSGTAEYSWTCLWVDATAPGVCNPSGTSWGYPLPPDGNNLIYLRSIASASVATSASQLLTTDEPPPSTLGRVTWAARLRSAIDCCVQG